ncbi:PadR family transcriptional regulator [Alicyclobacillus curvatus]|nr:PadR family transcriptional regulator [Alicyclobacillus curvatus]
MTKSVSTVRLLVLGSILRRGIGHGYAVYSDITSWHADSWTSVKPGSIYHALDKLESEGLIKACDSPHHVKLGPSRKEYTITHEGDTQFRTLLELTLVSSDIQQFSAGIAFMDMLSRNKVIAILQQRRAELKRSAQFLRSLPIEDVTVDPSKHPELVGIWVSYVENEAATTTRILEHVQAGKYAFLSERLVEE